MKKRILLCFYLTIFCTSLIFSQSILSEDRYWDNGGTDTKWTTVNNWSNDALPETDADVYINNDYIAKLTSGNSIEIESLIIGADASNNPNSTVMVPNTGGTFTIDNGATLLASRGGQEGSDCVDLEGASGHTSSLIVNGTLNIDGFSNGDGLEINHYTSVTVGSTGEINVVAYKKNGIKIKSDLTNSGTINITASAICDDGINFGGTLAGGATITNNSSGTIKIDGGGFMDFGMDLNSDFTFDNHGTVSISNTTDDILEGSFEFNNYGTFAGDGEIDLSELNFVAKAASHIAPGTTSVPIGTFTFKNDVNLSDVNLDIQINGAASYDQVVAEDMINITDATLNLSGTYTPVDGETYTFINKTSGGAITGTFDGLPEGGTFTYKGMTMTITYIGGDGNDIVLSASSPPLPVELISFNGKAEERSNILNWLTASEENTLVFLVERSENGVTDFKEIGRVEAFGFSNEIRRYEIEDINPIDLAYYRLRIVDFDGTFAFSDIIVIERSKTDLELVEVFPVPAEEEVTVLIRTQSDSKAILILSDFMGRKIKEEKIILKEGINRYLLNFENSESNFYFLTINNGKEKIAKKIIRVHKK